MPDRFTYDYAIVRVAPRVEREEFINVGVIVSCPDRKYLGCAIELDEDRLRALHPGVDVEMIRTHLATIEKICAGGEEAGAIGKLSQRERFHWLVAPRSTVIQMSPVHTGQCDDPARLLRHLTESMVRTSPHVPSGVDAP